MMGTAQKIEKCKQTWILNEEGRRLISRSAVKIASLKYEFLQFVELIKSTLDKWDNVAVTMMLCTATTTSPRHM